ncbi:MAG: alpha/beta fold hydrolase [Victivallales bacterium]|nr:alpha/beta fold hydrolase [Victivallales bacterium]
MDNKLIDRFKSLAASGELSQLIEHNSTLNIKAPILNGEVFWNSYESNGWKLQINTFSGWWRIVDANDVRVARGTTERQLNALLDNRPTSPFPNYMDEGFRFGKTPAKEAIGNTVVLIHGWGVRASSMQDLADELAERGFDAYSYDYPTSACSLSLHCEIFLMKFRDLMKHLPDNETIHILTHSMGGLVMRGALAKMSSEECHRIRAFVMLGPPNHGSALANISIIDNFNHSLKDMRPDSDSFVNNIPSPAWLPPVGIIAGRFDGKVPLESTQLPAPLTYDLTVVNCTHPGLRKPSNVLEHILAFYRKLSF